MKFLNVTEISRRDTWLLKRAFLWAIFLEFALLTFFGIQEHWLAHPQTTTGLDPSKFLEAEVYQIPKEAQLTEEKKIISPQAKEIALSKRPLEGKKTPQPHLEEKNQTTSGSAMAANHGPIAIVAPIPVIPGYLQDKDINSSVVIEFLVNNQGQAVPRLIGSSGNEELDAIALGTVKKWQFRPAEANHKPIDAKIRLRINFSVH
jgi:TonB family protein